jgi:hypothetical protein
VILKDKNETLKPPAGGEVCGVFAEGSYLRIRYQLPNAFTDVYLNDQGREVARLSWVLPEKPPQVKPVRPESQVAKDIDEIYSGRAFRNIGAEWSNENVELL